MNMMAKVSTSNLALSVVVLAIGVWHVCSTPLKLSPITTTTTTNTTTFGNVVHRRHKRALDPDETQLVYSTRTEIRAIPLSNIPRLQNRKSNSLDSAYTRVMEKSTYGVEMFDVSFTDRLALYGINTITAFPIVGGNNYLSTNSETSMSSIKFDPKAFAVDWVDHNVYSFYEKKLHLHRLVGGGDPSVVIMNASDSVRNIVIEHQRHFIAWIGNDANIVKANKDGSRQFTVHTSKKKIECMTVDPTSSRFFFFVMESISSSYRSMDLPDYNSGGGGGGGGGEDYGGGDSGGGGGGGGLGNRFAVLFSVDYNGEHAPVNEMQVKMSQPGAVPVQVAKYKDNIYMIREYENSGKGKVDELGMPNRRNEFQNLLREENWQITHMQVVYKVTAVRDLCARDNRCYSSICVHMTDETAHCVSSSEIYPLTTLTTRRPTTAFVTHGPKEMLFSFGKWLLVALAVVLVPIAVGLSYFGYYYFCADDDADKSLSQDGSGGVGGVGAPGALAGPGSALNAGGGVVSGVAGGPTGPAPPLAGSKVAGMAPNMMGVPQINADGTPTTPSQMAAFGAAGGAGVAPPPKQKNFFEKILDFLGFGSDIDEDQAMVDPEQANMQAMGLKQAQQGMGPKSQFPWGGGALKSKVRSVANLSQLQSTRGTLGPDRSTDVTSTTPTSGKTKEQPDKKSLSLKQRQRTRDRKQLYASLDKMLDTVPKKDNKSSKGAEGGTLPEDTSEGGEGKVFSFQKSKVDKKPRSTKDDEEDNNEGVKKKKSRRSVAKEDGDKERKEKKEKKKKHRRSKSNKSRSSQRSGIRSDDDDEDEVDEGSKETGSSLTTSSHSSSSRSKSRSKLGRSKSSSNASRHDKSSSASRSKTGGPSSAKTSSKMMTGDQPVQQQLQELPAKAVNLVKSMTSSLFTGSSIGPSSSVNTDGGPGTRKFKWYDPLGCC